MAYVVSKSRPRQGRSYHFPSSDSADQPQPHPNHTSYGDVSPATHGSARSEQARAAPHRRPAAQIAARPPPAVIMLPSPRSRASAAAPCAPGAGGSRAARTQGIWRSRGSEATRSRPPRRAAHICAPATLCPRSRTAHNTLSLPDRPPASHPTGTQLRALSASLYYCARFDVIAVLYTCTTVASRVAANARALPHARRSLWHSRFTHRSYIHKHSSDVPDLGVLWSI